MHLVLYFYSRVKKSKSITEACLDLHQENMEGYTRSKQKWLLGDKEKKYISKHTFKK